jgi:hypothetical protein
LRWNLVRSQRSTGSSVPSSTSSSPIMVT